MEREKIILKRNEKKLEEITMLKEQYEVALALKQHSLAREIEIEMNHIGYNLEIELKRQKLLKDEA